MRRIVFEPRNHLLMALGRVVDGVANPVKFAHMTAIFGHGSN
jgi:hypothetical protein